MSLLNKEVEPNFIEKRRAWKSDFDRKRKRSMLFAAVPAMILCLFVILSAPFIVKIVSKVFKGEKEIMVRPIGVAEEGLPFTELVPPPNPDLAIAEMYQKRFDEEGFDWRKTPVLEAPEEAALAVPERKIEPLNVDLLSVISPAEEKAASESAD